MVCRLTRAVAPTLCNDSNIEWKLSVSPTKHDLPPSFQKPKNPPNPLPIHLPGVSD